MDFSRIQHRQSTLSSGRPASSDLVSLSRAGTHSTPKILSSAYNPAHVMRAAPVVFATVAKASSGVAKVSMAAPIIKSAEVPAMLPMNAAARAAAPAKATGPFAFVQRKFNDFVNTVSNMWKAALASVGVLPKTFVKQVGGAVARMDLVVQEGLAAGKQALSQARA